MSKNKKNDNNNVLDLSSILDTSINNSSPDNNDLVALIAVSELTNLDKIRTISRLKPEQIEIITKLELFSDVFKIPFTKNLANKIMETQISINGLGRKELIKLVNQRENDIILPRKNKDIFR